MMLLGIIFLTNFSNDAIRNPSDEFNVWWETLSKYDGDNKAEQCKNWLMIKGLEESTLEKIRSIFIEGYKHI